MINKNFKFLLTLFTVFIGNVSYCMEDNSTINNNLEQKNNLPLFRLNDEEFTKYNNVLYNVNTLIDDVYNECIDTTNVVFDNIINTIENNFFITVDICDYLSSQTIVPLQKVQQVLKLFNTFEPSINKNSTAILFKELQLQFDKQSNELQISTNSNTITNINTSKNNIKEHTEITHQAKKISHF